MQKLVTRSAFAKLAGVNPSTTTRLCDTVLKACVVGKRIDAAHPNAVKYLENRDRAQTPRAATGIDPLHEHAVQACTASGRWSTSYLQRELRIGYKRASAIVATMKAAGLIPTKENPSSVPATEQAPEPKPSPKLRGNAARNEKKKAETFPDDHIFEVPEDIQAFAEMTLRELVQQFGTDIRFLDWLKATKAIEDINEKRLKNAETEGKLVARALIKVGIIEPFDAAHIKLLTDGAKTITRRVTAMHDAKRDLDEIEKFVKDQITSFIRPVKAKVARALRSA